VKQALPAADGERVRRQTQVGLGLAAAGGDEAAEQLRKANPGRLASLVRSPAAAAAVAE